MQYPLFSGEEYLISVPRLLSRAGQNSVRIVLSEQATPQDMLRAYFTAEYLLSLPESSRDLGTAHKYVVRNFPKFLRQVQDRGWNTQYAMLDPRVPRCKW
uniref:Root UVB sensitive protein C-terminal domain-containing protein n=1 Tax=Compsopogon caeruleus TaxID=31354 RepID=A0A7S1TGU1_9RHOD